RAVEGELAAEHLAAAAAQARSEGLAERGRELAARAVESRSEAERIAVRLAELARESAALRAEVDRLGAELPEAEAACAEAERHPLGELQRTLGAEETAQLAVLEQARAEATQLRSRADSLRELQARYEGCTRGVASLVGRAPGAVALLASVLRVPKDLERAVAAALGTRLA